MTDLEILLTQALEDLIALTESWAYGPLFSRAGIRWPGDECQSPALTRAKELLISTQEPRKPYHYCELCGINTVIRGEPPCQPPQSSGSPPQSSSDCS